MVDDAYTGTPGDQNSVVHNLLRWHRPTAVHCSLRFSGSISLDPFRRGSEPFRCVVEAERSQRTFYSSGRRERPQLGHFRWAAEVTSTWRTIWNVPRSFRFAMSKPDTRQTGRTSVRIANGARRRLSVARQKIILQNPAIVLGDRGA